MNTMNIIKIDEALIKMTLCKNNLYNLVYSTQTLPLSHPRRERLVPDMLQDVAAKTHQTVWKSGSHVVLGWWKVTERAKEPSLGTVLLSHGSLSAHSK